MALEFAALQSHPKQMDGDELQAALGDLPDSQIMRSLLIAEVQAIRGGAEREQRTMRGLWYELIKPALSRMGILNKKTAGGKDVPWDAKLSIYLAELVRAGYTSYEELSIIDGSRQRQAALPITSPVANVELVGAHFPWVILFTEKDTIYPVVQALAELYGVSVISGGGQPSNACTENTVREIVRSEAYQREQPETVVLLSLTDYDPAGYTIAGAQFAQVQEALQAMDRKELGGLKNIRRDRLGLNPAQLTPEERAANTYEPKDKGLAEWYEQTGGVDGQPVGLELDSLPLSRIRAMFADGIEQHVDLEKRRADLRLALLDLTACQLLLPDFNERRLAAIKAIVGGDLWKVLHDQKLPEDLFRQAALEGANAIDPLESGLFDCAGDVEQAMDEFLNGNGE